VGRRVFYRFISYWQWSPLKVETIFVGVHGDGLIVLWYQLVTDAHIPISTHWLYQQDMWLFSIRLSSLPNPSPPTINNPSHSTHPYIQQFDTKSQANRDHMTIKRKALLPTVKPQAKEMKRMLSTKASNSPKGIQTHAGCKKQQQKKEKKPQGTENQRL